MSLASIGSEAIAELRLPSILGSNMVLQQQLPVRIWGWANPGKEVSVDFAGQHKTTKADEKGAWKLELDAMPASAESRTLKVSAKGEGKTVELTNVLVGEVWICSGQSNMAMGFGKLKSRFAADFTESFPTMRVTTLPLLAAYRPKEDFPALSWVICDTNRIGQMSAVAFYFGRDLQRHLKVPIGLIVASVGGTPIEPWTPRSCFEADTETKPVLDTWEQELDAIPGVRDGFDEAHKNWLKTCQDYATGPYAQWKKASDEAKAAGKTAPPPPPDPNTGPLCYRTPTVIYNAMIAPLTSLTMRGVAWYQGESGSGTGNPEIYRKLFTAMIPAWRQAWNRGDFPFLIVQLPYITAANTDPNERAEVATSREGQRRAAAANPNTALVVTIDTGDDNDLHPANKNVVGARLALAARARAYGEKIAWSGPLVKSIDKLDGKVRVSFDLVGGGLVAKGDDGNLSDKAIIKGFALAGGDGKYFWANATIAGDTVLLHCAEVTKPVMVHYGYANHPVCTLFNRDGLPATPFEMKLATPK